MLLLTAITDKIQLVTTAAVTVDVHASVMDHTLASDNVEGVRQNTAITTAATTDIVSVPASGVTRNVKTLHIMNKHASSPVTVTVIYNQNAVLFELYECVLNPNETLEYIEGVGFFQTTTAVALFDRTVRVAASVPNATTSFIDITGLTWPVIAGRQYALEAHLYHTENAATTGPRWAVGGVAMTALRLGTIGTKTESPTTAAMIGGALATAVDTSAAGATTDGSTVAKLDIVSGWVNPSASGTLAMRFQSEVAIANGVTVLQGSWARLTESYN